MEHKRPSIDNDMYIFLENSIKATNLCKYIHPNLVTIFALMLLLPLHHYLKDRKPIAVFALVIIRVILDLADGQLARQCNKYTKLGSTLDSINDTLGCSLIAFHLLILIFPEYNHIIYYLSLALVWYIITECSISIDNNHKGKNWLGFVSVNNVFFFMLLLFVAWLLVLYYFTKRC